MSLLHPNSWFSPKRWIRMIWGMQDEYEDRVQECAQLCSRMQEAGQSDVELIYELESMLDEYNLGYQDISVTAKHIDRLVYDIQVRRGKELLATARDKASRSSYTIDGLHRYLFNRDMKPEDIGTTTQELDKLSKEVLLESARRYLRVLRKVENQDYAVGQMLLDKLKALNMTLQQIGSSKQEFEVLVRRAKVNTLQGVFQVIHSDEDPIMRSALLTGMKAMMKLESIQPEDFGITQEEIESIGDVIEEDIKKQKS